MGISYRDCVPSDTELEQSLLLVRSYERVRLRSYHIWSIQRTCLGINDFYSSIHWLLKISLNQVYLMNIPVWLSSIMCSVWSNCLKKRWFLVFLSLLPGARMRCCSCSHLVTFRLQGICFSFTSAWYFEPWCRCSNWWSDSFHCGFSGLLWSMVQEPMPSHICK